MSSSIKSLLLVAVGTLCGVGGIKACVYFEQRTPRAVAATRTPATETDAQSAPRVRQSPAEPRALAPAPLAAMAEAPQAHEAPTDPTPSRTDEEVRFQVEQRFQREPPASPAAVAFSRTVEEAFVAKADAGAHVRGVQCRDVLCQVSLQFDSNEAERSVMSDVLLYGPLRKYASIVPARSEDGEAVSLTVYVAREGQIPVE